jgi:hypothetical protein
VSSYSSAISTSTRLQLELASPSFNFSPPASSRPLKMVKGRPRKRQSSSAATGSQPSSRINSPIGSERPLTSNSFHSNDFSHRVEEVQQGMTETGLDGQQYSQQMDQGEL